MKSLDAKRSIRHFKKKLGWPVDLIAGERWNQNDGLVFFKTRLIPCTRPFESAFATKPLQAPIRFLGKTLHIQQPITARLMAA